MYELEPLSNQDIEGWDRLIAPYDTRQFFHQTAWLQYLAESRGAQIRYWAILANGKTIGYFTGGIIRKGPYTILGSPLRGWGTNRMGPIAARDFDQREFLIAIDQLAAQERLAMVELESDLLTEPVMQQSGHECVSSKSYMVELTPEDPDIMWHRLHPKARKAVRLAKQNNLVVEDCTDPAIVNELYDEWIEILSRKKLSPQYPSSCVRLAFDHLRSRDLMFALLVRSPDGTPLATGFFPHDERTLYFSFTGSRIAHWKLFPNDLLQWSAMEAAASKGLRVYDMCGYNYFKSKFGGKLCVTRRWHKFYSRTARLARWSYERAFDIRLRVRGWMYGHARQTIPESEDS